MFCVVFLFIFPSFLSCRRKSDEFDIFQLDSIAGLLGNSHNSDNNIYYDVAADEEDDYDQPHDDPLADLLDSLTQGAFGPKPYHLKRRRHSSIKRRMSFSPQERKPQQHEGKPQQHEGKPQQQEGKPELQDKKIQQSYSEFKRYVDQKRKKKIAEKLINKFIKDKKLDHATLKFLATQPKAAKLHTKKCKTATRSSKRKNRK